MIPAYNLMVCHPNRIDGATTLSGGAWVESLPLDNLKDRALARVARSIDVSINSTKFTIAFDRQRTIRALALLAHTISFSGRIRIRASDQSDFSVLKYDATVDAWPATGGDWNINELEWENDNYWLGSYSQEDTEGQTAIFLHLLPQNVQARYWRINIIDIQNAAGYIDIGRVFIGDAFLHPQINMLYGASLGYEDSTGIETAISGAEYFDPREPLRVARFHLGHLTKDESFAQALELTRRAGIWKEVLAILDPTDKTYGPVQSFVGRLRQLNPLEMVMHGYSSMAFEIKELR